MDIIMENKKDKLKASLERNLPTVSKAKPLVVDKDIKDDYEFSRKTYKDLINTGVGSLDILAELAREYYPKLLRTLVILRIS
jgi:hypothetical protein